MTTTPQPRDFTARISDHDPKRAAVWRMVFQADEVPLRSPFAATANLPERGATLVYDLAIEDLTAEQRERLVAHIAGRFSVPAEEVEAQLDVIGCPLLAEDVVITIGNPWRWIDFGDDLEEEGGFDAWEDEDELAYLFDDDDDDEDLMP